MGSWSLGPGKNVRTASRLIFLNIRVDDHFPESRGNSQWRPWMRGHMRVYPHESSKDVDLRFRPMASSKFAPEDFSLARALGLRLQYGRTEDFVFPRKIG